MKIKHREYEESGLSCIKLKTTMLHPFIYLFIYSFVFYFILIMYTAWTAGPYGYIFVIIGSVLFGLLLSASAYMYFLMFEKGFSGTLKMNNQSRELYYSEGFSGKDFFILPKKWKIPDNGSLTIEKVRVVSLSSGQQEIEFSEPIPEKTKKRNDFDSFFILCWNEQADIEEIKQSNRRSKKKIYTWKSLNDTFGQEEQLLFLSPQHQAVQIIANFINRTADLPFLNKTTGKRKIAKTGQVLGSLNSKDEKIVLTRNSFRDISLLLFGALFFAGISLVIFGKLGGLASLGLITLIILGVTNRTILEVKAKNLVIYDQYLGFWVQDQHGPFSLSWIESININASNHKTNLELYGEKITQSIPFIEEENAKKAKLFIESFFETKGLVA